MANPEPIDVLLRARRGELDALAAVLGTAGLGRGRDAADQLWRDLSYNGSHDLAYLLRGQRGVPYEEIVWDVAMKVGAKPPAGCSVEVLEAEVLATLLMRAFEKLSPEERDAAIKNVKYNPRSAATGFGPAVAALGGMGVGIYASSQIVGMTLVLNVLAGAGIVGAPMVATLAAVAPVVGWVLGGVWLANQVAGPAFRKTVPAVLMLGSFRQAQNVRCGVGVVGRKNTGKTTCLNVVFGIDSAQPSARAGATKKVTVYNMETDSPEPGAVAALRVADFPGANDLRKAVNDEQLNYSEFEVFVHILDVNGGVDPLDREIREELLAANKRVVTVFNKCDNVKKPADPELLAKDYADELGAEEGTFIAASLSPDPDKRGAVAKGIGQVRQAVADHVLALGRDPTPFFSRVFWMPAVNE